MMRPDREVDVAIVGAGPAGASAAIEMRTRGFDVALLDKSTFPRHKICGDFLTPGTAGRLARIDAEAFSRVSPATLDGMRITFEGTSILSDFPPDRRGWSLSRFQTDEILLRRAEREGARLFAPVRVDRFYRHPGGGHQVEGTYPDGGRMAVRAGLLVEAGGRHGLIARRLGWRRVDARLTRYALWSHMQGVRGLGARGEMHVFRGGYVGIAPLDPDGTANVTMVLTPSMMSKARGNVLSFFRRTLENHPELGIRLAEARFIAPLKGTGPLACRSDCLVGDGVALVGDAGGFVDPFTGEGVFIALESSRLLAEAVAAGSPESYERAFRARFGSKLLLCRLLQTVIARPWLARPVARALSSRKELADRMVGATGDLLPASSVLNPYYLGRLLLAGMLG